MLRPVDMAMPLQRTADVRAQTTGQNQPHVQHQHFADRLNKMAEQAEKQVAETEKKNEEASVNKDGKGHNQYGGNKKGKKQKQEEDAPRVKVSSSMFDVSI